MALKLTLKPHEKLILGNALVRNGEAKASLVIENKVPILREKDILAPDAANTPCKRLYFIVQLMYVDAENLPRHHESYWKLVRDITAAAPSQLALIDRINQDILVANYYRALKGAKKLICFEEEVVSRVRNASGSL